MFHEVSYIKLRLLEEFFMPQPKHKADFGGHSADQNAMKRAFALKTSS